MLFLIKLIGLHVKILIDCKKGGDPINQHSSDNHAQGKNGQKIIIFQGDKSFKLLLQQVNQAKQDSQGDQAGAKATCSSTVKKGLANKPPVAPTSCMVLMINRLE